jgi:flagellar capping protein FliD
VEVGADTKAIADAVENFAAAYNKQLSFLQDNQNVITSSVQNQIQGAVNENAGALSAMGIETGDNGELVVNRDQLEEAIATNVNEVRDTFRGGGGVATESYNAARRIVETPMDQTTANALSSLSSFNSYNNLGYLIHNQVALSNFMLAQNQGFFINMLA